MLVRRGDRFPTIKKLLETYDEIRDDLAKGNSGAGDPDCPDCYGEGRLYILRTYPDMKDATGKLVPYELMCRCGRCSRDRGNRKIPASDRGRIEQNPNVIKILNEKPSEKPLPKMAVTEKDLSIEFGSMVDDEELRFKEAERKAILEEQRRSLGNEKDNQV